MRISGDGFLAAALAHAGRPYTWDCKGPEAFDCSGLITYTLWECGGPDWRTTYTAARLFKVLEPFVVETKAFGETLVPMDPPAGVLAFYGPPPDAEERRSMHVMICVGDGRVFGACGGGPQTLTPQRGACVQYRGSLRYRPDFAGLRRLPEAKPLG